MIFMLNLRENTSLLVRKARKHYTWILLLSLLSCSINYNEQKLLGKKLKYRFIYKSDKLISKMGFYEKYYIAKKADIVYYLSLDSKMRIYKITVGSRNFRTPENIKVGDSLDEVQEKTGKKLATDFLSYYILLDSGWNAYFKIIREGDVIVSANVMFFVKAKIMD